MAAFIASAITCPTCHERIDCSVIVIGPLDYVDAQRLEVACTPSIAGGQKTRDHDVHFAEVGHALEDLRP